MPAVPKCARCSGFVVLRAGFCGFKFGRRLVQRCALRPLGGFSRLWATEERMTLQAMMIAGTSPTTVNGHVYSQAPGASAYAWPGDVGLLVQAGWTFLWWTGTQADRAALSVGAGIVFVGFDDGNDYAFNGTVWLLPWMQPLPAP